MAAPRTIDSDGPGSVFIGARFSARQAAELDALASRTKMTRSALIRHLVNEAYQKIPEQG
jgi:hypothetical protein